MFILSLCAGEKQNTFQHQRADLRPSRPIVIGYVRRTKERHEGCLFLLAGCKDSDVDHRDARHSISGSHSSSTTPTTRRTTRSTTSLLSRMAQSSSSDCSSSPTESSSSSSELCSSSSILSLSSISKRCSCLCHHQDAPEVELHLDLQQSHAKYANITPLATFHAHKAVLIARSSSFAAQIRASSHRPQQQQQSYHSIGYSSHSKLPSIDLYIDDLDPSTVRTVLIYIYTGRLVSSTDEIKTNLNPIDLFRAAVKYDLNELRQLAKSTMLEVLKIDNAIEMLEVSDQANDLALKQQVLAFIRSNAAAVSKTTHWVQFTKRHPQLIIDAFRSLVTPSASSSSSSSSSSSPSTTTTAKHNSATTASSTLTHHSTSLTTSTSKQYSKYD